MSVMIAIPGNWVSDKTMVSLFDLGKLFQRANIDHAILTLNNSSLITAARSSLANFFLHNTNKQYILFLDSDIRFDPLDVLKLLNHNKEIVCGDYPCKVLPLTYNAVISQPPKNEGKNLVAIDSVGIGFTLIHRSVFQKITDRYNNELKCRPSDSVLNYNHSDYEKNNYYHFFSELKREEIFYSEDRSFFIRAKDCGVQAWLDTSIKLSHVGLYEFGRQNITDITETNPFEDLKGFDSVHHKGKDNGKFIE